MTMAASAHPAPVADPNYYTAAMSYAEWKREPTLLETLFRLQLPYRPPSSFIGKFLWRRRVWVEVTFALSMLEPWEKFLVCEYHPPLFFSSSLYPPPSAPSLQFFLRVALGTPGAARAVCLVSLGIGTLTYLRLRFLSPYHPPLPIHFAPVRRARIQWWSSTSSSGCS